MHKDISSISHGTHHLPGRTHSGIFVIYRDNNARKDMTYADIVRAIANLVASGLPIVNEIYILAIFISHQKY